MLSFIGERLAVPMDGEASEMLTGHLALSLERARSGQEFSDVSVDLLRSQFEGKAKYVELAAEIAANAEKKLHASLPEVEVYFLAAHLVNVAKKPPGV